MVLVETVGRQELGERLVRLAQLMTVLTETQVIPEITARLAMVVPQEMQETLGLLAMQELVAMVAHEVTAGRLVAAATVAALV